MTDPLVLITAATGKVGPHVARELVSAGVRVRALVLPGDDREHLLPAQVEIVHGSLADGDAVAAALHGVSGVYWMWPFFHLDVAAAPRMIELMEAQGAHVVLVSSVGVHIGLEPVSNNCHAYLEQLLNGSNLSAHFLRTTGFMGNALGFAHQIIQDDTVRFPYGEATRRSVHEGDLAAVGVRLLLDPGATVDRALLISGPEAMTQAEQVARIGAVIGRSLTWTDVDADEARHQLVQAGWPPDYADGALEYFLQLTRTAEVGSDSVRQILGRPAKTFDEWAHEHQAAFRPG